MIVDLDGSLSFASFPIPGGNMPVQMAVLRDEPSIRARTLVVRFPSGWRREGPGFYEAAEELVVLSGSLQMSGITYAPGDWGYVPTMATRFETVSATETVVFARFAGAARYHEGAGSADEHRRLSLRSISLDAKSPLQGAGRLLNDEAVQASWLLDAPPPNTPAVHETELLALDQTQWSFTPAGEPLPAAKGLCFARIFKAESKGAPS